MLLLAASHYHWQQQIDHRGRPRSQVRAGSWRFATSLLDQASYQHLLELMLSPTTVVEARATYGRADGQGTFVTVWGRHCTVSHVFSHFDARGTPGRRVCDAGCPQLRRHASGWCSRAGGRMRVAVGNPHVRRKNSIA